ncbi:hypothetical protein AVEN_83724-1 [Araneus ventricosus]|uniref:Sushi domain-containing protein n=1 Tax=Araneus ventricosus TaxID=182803 RepID=A0A4Y2EU18_ARAVE|nr:hypothetical protein AVEN_83724-1 [Araneus ventricosus]
MDCPSYSPDMNPIEHVWNILGRRVAGRLAPSETIPKLQSSLLQEWERIHTIQTLINDLIYFLPRFQDVVCTYRSYQRNDEKTKYFTVLVSPDKKSTIFMCEISVFAKDDDWCGHPPENSVPNGQLEVGRSKAVLHCNDGFKEKDGRRVYATCRNNKWSYVSLECVETSCGLAVGNLSSSEGEWKSDGKTIDFFGTTRTLKCEPGYHSEGEPITVTCLENRTWTRTSATCKEDMPQKDYKILAIVVGLVIFIVILTLVGSTIFLIRRKKPIGLFVIFKPGGNNSYSSSRYVDDHSTTSLYEAENSTACVIKRSETTG